VDTIFILETPVCCYHYDSELKARGIFLNDKKINDRRLNGDWLWSEEEKALWEAEIEASPGEGEWTWRGKILEEYLEREPRKTLVVMEYDAMSAWLFIELARGGGGPPRPRPDERWLFLSFFHSDEDTVKMLTGWTNERMLEEKFSWMHGMMNFPFIKRVEIPIDKTLTEEYLRDLFQEYALSKTPAEMAAEIRYGG